MLFPICDQEVPSNEYVFTNPFALLKLGDPTAKIVPLPFNANTPLC